MNTKKICYTDKKGNESCVERIGNPMVVRKYVFDSLLKAIEEGKDSINPNEEIFKAEERAQKEGKISPFIQRNMKLEEYEKIYGELK